MRMASERMYVNELALCLQGNNSYYYLGAYTSQTTCIVPMQVKHILARANSRVITHSHTHIHTHTHTYTHTLLYTHTCTHTHTYTHAHTHTRTHSCTHTHAHTLTHMYID